MEFLKNNYNKIIVAIYILASIAFVITRSEYAAGLIIMGCCYAAIRIFASMGCFVTAFIFFLALLYASKEFIMLFFK